MSVDQNADSFSDEEAEEQGIGKHDHRVRQLQQLQKLRDHDGLTSGMGHRKLLKSCLADRQCWAQFLKMILAPSTFHPSTKSPPPKPVARSLVYMLIYNTVHVWELVLMHWVTGINFGKHAKDWASRSFEHRTHELNARSYTSVTLKLWTVWLGITWIYYSQYIPPTEHLSSRSFSGILRGLPTESPNCRIGRETVDVAMLCLDFNQLRADLWKYMFLSWVQSKL